MSTEYEEKDAATTAQYRQLGQGIKILHDDKYAEVDIVAVPGLGTNPMECWTWTARNSKDKDKPSLELSDDATTQPQTRRSFNWLRDREGLAHLFPQSRIMLYDYASAWQGSRKVRATMKSVCVFLLEMLKENRKTSAEIMRPLIFIGHSMGGIVIAKALTIAKAKTEYEAIVNHTMGCTFFGVPFQGSNMARVALQYSAIFGNDAYESLLSFMSTQKNDNLDDVTEDFMEISNKLNPPIELFCAWEQNPTKIDYSERALASVPALLEHRFFKAGARKLVEIGLTAVGGGTHFVEKESAVLKGARNLGLTAGHSDLIKFESVTCEKFLPIKAVLSGMVRSAKVNSRKRATLSGQNLLTQRFVNRVQQSLEGVDMRAKFRAREVRSSWLVKDQIYLDWKGDGMAVRPCLWLRSAAGLGKTNACLASIRDISNNIDKLQANVDVSQNDTFLAYFLCDWSIGCSTAEDLLKSLITQLILQESSLAQHARWFVAHHRNTGDGDEEKDVQDVQSGAKATATVDNLWKCLQDMMDDPVVNSMHVVLCNIHCLEKDSGTTALLAKLVDYICHGSSLSETSQNSRVKWLITSRSELHLASTWENRATRVIDLENDSEYGRKVTAARVIRAKEAVKKLRDTKRYSSKLSYSMSNTISKQSAGETWIDVVCILLGGKPASTSDLAIENWLKDIGKLQMHELIDEAWSTILRDNGEFTLEIEELMRVLTITYEPLNMTELAIFTNVNSQQRLADLVQRCSPIISIGSDSEHKDKVAFANATFRTRLFDKYYEDEDQRHQQHGRMALDCFHYIKEAYQPDTEQPLTSLNGSELQRSKSVRVRMSKDAVIVTAADDDDNEHDGLGPVVAETSNATTLYPVKYLFRHLSESFTDAVDELVDEDEDFWGRKSGLRDAWLKEFQSLMPELKDLDVRGMSALHVAASIGAGELVTMLVERTSRRSLAWTNDAGMTALHVAAFNNHAQVVEALLRIGASVDAGDKSTGTPLHYAGLRGHCKIMELLINSGASVNAYSQEIGPVINAAIRSGTVDAVKQIMDRDVRFDSDYTKCASPLSLSAGYSEPKLFTKILDTGREKWLKNVKLIDGALIEAATSGHLDSVKILLDFPHQYTNTTLQDAISSAARELNWAPADTLLDFALTETSQGVRRDVMLDEVFYLAAAGRDERLDLLGKIWKLTQERISPSILAFSLYQATALKKTQTAIWLLQCGIDANASAKRPMSIEEAYANINSTVDYLTTLNAAAATGNAQLVSALIDHGAMLDADNCYALHLSAAEGHKDTVKILLERGAQVNREVPENAQLRFYSGTALQAACDNEKEAIVKLLIDHKADPNLGGGILTNPITSATQHDRPQILRLLLQAENIKVNVSGGDDRSTPLINAAAHMHTDIVQLLLDKGADINAVNGVGDSALIVAASRGSKECVELLCDHGADVTYRSTTRGLPISVAAEASHPECAHILAEIMVSTIERYRTESPITQNMLEDRNNVITDLEDDLEEMKQERNTLQSEVMFLKADKERHEASILFQGHQFESRRQEIVHLQLQLAEKDRQIEGSKGVGEYAEQRVREIAALLEQEKETNAKLRRRQGWTELQEVHKVALQKNEEQATKIEELELQSNTLKQSLNKQSEKASVLMHELEVARGQESAYEQQIRGLQDDLQKQQDVKIALESHARELQARLDTVQAYMQNSTSQTILPSPPSAAGQFPQRVLTTTLEDERGEAGQVSTGFVESPGIETPESTPRSPVPGGSQGNTVTRPGFRTAGYRSNSSGDGTLRSVHGNHRSDGSLGGYRSRPQQRASVQFTNAQRSASEASNSPESEDGFVAVEETPREIKRRTWKDYGRVMSS